MAVVMVICERAQSMQGALCIGRRSYADDLPPRRVSSTKKNQISSRDPDSKFDYDVSVRLRPAGTGAMHVRTISAEKRVKLVFGQ